jgi:hypothetical protein
MEYLGFVPNKHIVAWGYHIYKDNDSVFGIFGMKDDKLGSHVVLDKSPLYNDEPIFKYKCE